jgi:hypothetical protein
MLEGLQRRASLADRCENQRRVFAAIEGSEAVSIVER